MEINRKSASFFSKLTIGRVMGWMMTGLIVILFCFFAALAAIRFIIFPNIHRYHEQIAEFLSNSVGVTITFGELEADWAGYNIIFVLKNVVALDEDGTPALILDRVHMALSWETLFKRRLILRQLSIDSPEVYITKISSDLMYIGGFKVESGSSDGTVKEWFLYQKEVLIQNAKVHWQDLSRDAPRLSVSNIDFLLQNNRRRHRFALRNMQQGSHFKSLDIRGDLRGRSKDDFSKWQGRMYANVEDLDLSAWRQWIDYPVDLTEGLANGQFWVSLRKGTPVLVEVLANFDEIAISSGDSMPPIEIVNAETQLIWQQKPDYQVLDAVRFNIETKEGIRLAPKHLRASWRTGLSDGTGFTGRFLTDDLDVGAISYLNRYLPLPENIASILNGLSPNGLLDSADITWQIPKKAEDIVFKVNIAFENLSATAYDSIPGFTNLTGRLEGNQNRGNIQLGINQGSLSLPDFFDEPRLPINQLTVNGGWAKENDRWRLNIAQLEVKNNDLTGKANGYYILPTDQPLDEGDLDLTASIGKASALSVPRYLPNVLGTALPKWLSESIKGGQVNNINFRIKGPVASIPFPNSQEGTFNIAFDIENGILRFDSEWPEIHQLNAKATITNTRLTIEPLQGASEQGVGITAKVLVDNLLADSPIVNVEGQAKGPAADFLTFVENTPLKETVGNVLEEATLKGETDLSLKLAIPVEQPDTLKVEGNVTLTDACLFVEELPSITRVKAQVQFNEKGIQQGRAEGRVFGGEVNVVARQENEVLRIRATGESSVRRILHWADLELEDRVSGRVAWRAGAAIRDQAVNFMFNSDLVGLNVDFPVPLKKTADQRVDLHLERRLMPYSDFLQAEYQWRLTLGEMTEGQWYQKATEWALTRGKIFFGFEAGDLMQRSPFPERGFTVGGRIEAFDVNEWITVAESLSYILPVGEQSNASSLQEDMPLKVNLGFKEITVFNRPFTDLILRTQINGDDLTFNFESEGINGNISWETEGKGKLIARFDRISIPPVKPDIDEVSEVIKEKTQPIDSLPSVDFIAENLLYEGGLLGRVEFRAVNRRTSWDIRKFYIENGGGKLEATGRWFVDEDNIKKTALNFTIDVNQIDKLLPIPGIDDQIRGGNGEIKGNLRWNGPPTTPDYASVSGQMSANLANGSIVQADPGFLGKMLGLISLQSIGRFLTFDLNLTDKGFQFDSLSGNVRAIDGIIETDDRITIIGPVGRITMRGTVDLHTEVVDMNIRVLPTISDSLSVLITTLNPIAGAIAFVAQRVLQDPFSYVIQQEYKVTGSLSHPKVVQSAKKVDSVDDL